MILQCGFNLKRQSIRVENSFFLFDYIEILNSSKIEKNLRNSE